MRPQRFSAAMVAVLVLAARLAVADAWDPPAGYYDAATGTGATLKQQLDTIMTTGHMLQTYGDARFILADTDEDPNNSSNVLLFYHRTSVSKTWVPNSNAFGTREHVWPTSRRPDSAPSNNTISMGSDIHMLKPLDMATNNSRGNDPFGTVGTTGNNRAVGSYYYPGDADRGDAARIIFYGATRWKDEGLKLVNGIGIPANYEMGDLTSLLDWHYLDPPDDFERRRNQRIDLYQKNRNAYIDRPEYVWSVYVDQTNDSQISIAGATVGGDGASTRNVDLGRVFVGGAVPSAQNFTLNKGGDDGTYYQVTTAGDATSSVSGRYNSFRMGGTDSNSIAVGLDTSTSTAGLRSGIVTIDNLDVTTGGCGGVGCGANDADDTFDVSLAVLDHPVASFSANIEKREEVIDFGIIPLGSGIQSSGLSITNLAAPGAPEFAANLDFDGMVGVGDTSAFQIDLSPFTGLEQNDFFGFDLFFFPNAVGQFEATYTLNLSDEDLPGEQTQTLMLSLVGEVILPGDYNQDGVVDTGDYIAWRRAYGQNVPAYSGADGDGNSVIGDGDHAVWVQNFGRGGGGGASDLSAAVPEPTSAWLAVMSLALCYALRRKVRRLDRSRLPAVPKRL